MTEEIKPNQLVVFDFDWSLVDQDTDRYLFEVLDPDLRMRLELQKESIQWTDNVAECLRLLYQSGVKKDQIIQAFSTLPLHPGMKRGIENLKKDETQIKTSFIILSNSNLEFIKIVLNYHQFDLNLFQSIITNPAEFNQDGMLVLNRRIPFDFPIQHSCVHGCSPNMCKGEELKKFLDSSEIKFDRIVYVGDGSNDFCPITQFKSNDVALIRRNMGLSKKIKEDMNELVKCEKVYWNDAWELEMIFRNQICKSV
ncbi:phosphatase phospho-type [Melampsora americana]|nr:phosphatase phospho-type [Melampsora americana]